MTIETLPALRPSRAPWNKGRIVGQKLPLQPKHVWSIRVRLEMADNRRDLALFNMAVDSKLRGCHLVGLRVNDVYAAGHVKERASVSPILLRPFGACCLSCRASLPLVLAIRKPTRLITSGALCAAKNNLSHIG